MAGFVTIEQVGPSFQQVTDQLIRELTAANKAVGKQAATVGRKAMLADVKARRGSLSFGGGRLNVRTRVRSRPNECEVEYRGQSAGAWKIISSNRGSYQIRRRDAKALHWGGDGYATHVTHPGRHGNPNYWELAGKALDDAVADIIGDIFDKALAA